MTTHELHKMSDDALIEETKRVAAIERNSTAQLLSLLIEVERRQLHLALGHSSLFVYCVKVLHLSEQASYSRITAARAARRFPALLELLASGALTLSSVGILVPHLTDETFQPILDAAKFKSTRDVERRIATLYPQPDIPATLRATPAPVAALPLTASTPEPARESRPVVAPLAPRRYLLRVTIGQDTHDKLSRVRGLLRHSIPSGDLEAILDRALTRLLEEAERTKFAATARPKASSTLHDAGRHVPAGVRRQVWTRDGGRCAFTGSDGRCEATEFLEFHHIVPFAVGGLTTADNLQLRCRSHNAYEATRPFPTDLPTRRAPS